MRKEANIFIFLKLSFFLVIAQAYAEGPLAPQSSPSPVYVDPQEVKRNERLRTCEDSSELSFETPEMRKKFCRPFILTERSFTALKSGLFCWSRLTDWGVSQKSALAQCHWFLNHPSGQLTLFSNPSNRDCVEKLADLGFDDFTLLSCEARKSEWVPAFKLDSFSSCMERIQESVSPKFFDLAIKRNLDEDAAWKNRPESAAVPFVEDCLYAPASRPMYENLNRQILSSVRFLGSYDFHADDVYYAWWMPFFSKRKPAPIQGLSGLTYSPEENRFFAVNDSKYRPRLYEFKIDFKHAEPDYSESRLSALEVSPKDTTRLDYRQASVRSDYDFEDLILLDSGHFLLSSEPMVHSSLDSNGMPTYQSLLSVFDREGKHRYDWKLPEEFLPEVWRSSDNDRFSLAEGATSQAAFKRQERLLENKGVRNNLAFEGLTQSPDHGRVFYATEQGLRLESRYQARIQVMTKTKGGYFPSHQYLYPLEAIGDNGLSALTALSSTELLVLERSYDSTKNQVTVKLYYVDLGTGASSPENPVLLKKKLLIELDSVIPFLPPGLRTIDNLEGMTLGPSLDSGEKTLVLVSDNNENPRQRTQFIALALNIPEIKRSILEREVREESHRKYQTELKEQVKPREKVGDPGEEVWMAPKFKPEAKERNGRQK